jgi:PhnB protein
MNEPPVPQRHVPEGSPTVIPRIVVHDAAHFVDFLRRLFRATGEYRPDRPATMRIGDSLVMVSDAGIRSPMQAFLYVYVEDTDEAYRRALEAGATSLEEPAQMPYGDRRCMVRDPWGNTWQIATHGGASGNG